MDGERCITCGDQADPMRVVELAEDGAVCVGGEERRELVAVDLVEPVAVGDRLLVHAGVAIGRVPG